MARSTSVKSQDPAPYAVNPVGTDDEVIARALEILAARVHGRSVLDSPQAVKDYLRVRFAGLEHEVFSVVLLDSQNRVIDVREMFRGTLNQASVYPREIVKAALAANAGAVILTHNHPSGLPEPSRADEYLTQTLKSALALVDVRVLDHLVVGASGCVSFAERGLI
jgi:DNA repair protein RadC